MSKWSKMVDLKIECATGTRKPLSDLTTSNGVTPLEPSMEEINVNAYRSAFNTTSNGKPCHHSKYLLAHTLVLQRKRKHS